MNINDRIQEIVTSMKSFSAPAYHRSEVLTELFALQKEMVDLTFNDVHADLAGLKIWDVEKHLEQMNEECGGVATKDLICLKAECRQLCDTIKGEISGNRGEHKTFRSLELLKTENRIVKNVELASKDFHTELDAVVLTKKGIFIVEVKNTSRNVFIDEKGDYYRVGDYMALDSHLGSKLSVKERLLLDAIAETGFAKHNIVSIVVFTDNRAQVQNKNEYITTTFLSQLPYLIDEYQGSEIYTEKNLIELENAIEANCCRETYPVKIDVPHLKLHFATVMATLEAAKATNDFIKNTDDSAPESSETTNTEAPEFEKAVRSNTLNFRRVHFIGTVAVLTLNVILAAVAIRRSL